MESLKKNEILELFKERLLDTEVMLVCINCGWSSRTKVSRLKVRLKYLECPMCSSMMIAVAHPMDAEDFLRAFKKKLKHGKKLEKNAEKAYRRLIKAADLVQSYGFDAVLALASYGTGPDTAAKLLSQYRDEALLVALMEREREFIRTRRFWEDPPKKTAGKENCKNS